MQGFSEYSAVKPKDWALRLIYSASYSLLRIISGVAAYPVLSAFFFKKQLVLKTESTTKSLFKATLILSFLSFWILGGRTPQQAKSDILWP